MSACCGACEKGSGCESKPTWRRIEPVGCAATVSEAASDPQPVPSEEPLSGIAFELEPGSPASVASRLSLTQSEGTVSQAYELGPCTTVRVEAVLLNLLAQVLPAPPLTVTLESSLDLENWRSESQVPLLDLGYATCAVRGLTSRFVRMRYLGGDASGFKAVLAVTLTGSSGPRHGGRRAA